MRYNEYLNKLLRKRSLRCRQVARVWHSWIGGTRPRAPSARPCRGPSLCHWRLVTATAAITGSETGLRSSECEDWLQTAWPAPISSSLRLSARARRVWSGLYLVTVTVAGPALPRFWRLSSLAPDSAQQRVLQSPSISNMGPTIWALPILRYENLTTLLMQSLDLLVLGQSPVDIGLHNP